VIYSIQGLRESDPNENKWARIKKSSGTSQPVATQFPLEVHGYNGNTFLVGYISKFAKSILDGTESGEIILWMRRSRKKGRRATVLVEIPLSRIKDEGSRGLGTWKSPYHLFLQLA